MPKTQPIGDPPRTPIGDAVENPGKPVRGYAKRLKNLQEPAAEKVPQPQFPEACPQVCPCKTKLLELVPARGDLSKGEKERFVVIIEELL